MLSILASLLSAVASPAAQCHPGWDLAADWSDAQNPNGAWSYNAGAAPIAAHQADWASSGNPAWAGAASGFGHVPAWMRVVPAGSLALGPDASPGVVVMHGNDPASGNDVDLANVTWTSPVTGNLWLHGEVWHTDAHARATDWRLTLGGTLLDSGTLTQGDAFGPHTPRGFHFPISVVAGDVVRLEFQRADPLGTLACVRLAITRSPLYLASPVLEPGSGADWRRFHLRGANPFGQVIIAWSFQSGVYGVPGCGSLRLCLRQPHAGIAGQTNAAGELSVPVQLPPSVLGREFFFQAVELLGVCHTSNRVRHTF